MNTQLFNFLYSFAHRLNFIDKLIVFFAVYFPYIVILCALVFIFFYRKSLREIFLVFISGISAYVLAYLLKLIIRSSRPFDALTGIHSLFAESGYGFPSGHATFFSAIAFAIYFKHKRAGYVFIVCALLIGFARIMGGVHFPLDILGGYLLGFLVAFLFKTI